MRGRGPQDHRPIRPRHRSRALLRRHRQQFVLMHNRCSLAIRGTKAVRAGVATAEDYDLLVLGGNRHIKRYRIADIALVLLWQELHREVDPLEVTSGYR